MDDHGHGDETALDATAQMIRAQETLRLLTVGIDIGSSTTHLLFARVLLRRLSHDLSSRFVVVDRRTLWRSPVRFTPFLADGTIDAAELRRFVQRCYSEAGVTPSSVDSGAVILTGEAIKKKNARAVDDVFAAESGRFVCATAGHNLEAILAAHGSGATALSRERDSCGLHVDIGGGTTKLALVDRGEVLSTAALAVGGRLLARDRTGTWSRADEAARRVAAALGIGTEPADIAAPEARAAVVARLAALVVDQIVDGPIDDLGRALLLTAPLERAVAPTYVTLSGGVAEHVFGHETRDHGDIAHELAVELTTQLAKRTALPLLDPGQRIRATVIGASQFTVQVSGKTLHLAGAAPLPVQNVPVVHLGTPVPDVVEPDAVAHRFVRNAARHDRALDSIVALAFTWCGPPDYRRLLAMGRAIMAAAAPHGRRAEPLVLVVDGDVGQTLGRLLTEELGLAAPLISVDGVQVTDLDFVDIGDLLDPPGVLPVVIKSLVFASDAPA